MLFLTCYWTVLLTHTFIILKWPGYQELGCIKTINTRRITTCKLAGKVAFEYEEFFKVVPPLWSLVFLFLIMYFSMQEALQEKHTASMFCLTPELFHLLQLLNIRRASVNIYQAGYSVS